MLNWFRGVTSGDIAGEPMISGRIRIAFPAFGVAAVQPVHPSLPQPSVSREEIAELLQSELRPART